MIIDIKGFFAYVYQRNEKEHHYIYYYWGRDY